MRGGAINNAWQWLEQREERRIMAIPPMQPLPLARLALIPLSFFSATDFYSVTLAGGKFRGLEARDRIENGFIAIFMPSMGSFFGSLDRKPRDNVVFHRRRQRGSSLFSVVRGG